MCCEQRVVAGAHSTDKDVKGARLIRAADSSHGGPHIEICFRPPALGAWGRRAKRPVGVLDAMRALLVGLVLLSLDPTNDHFANAKAIDNCSYGESEILFVLLG